MPVALLSKRFMPVAKKSKMEWKFIIGKEKAERKLLKFSDEFRGQYCGPTHVHENEFVHYEIATNVL